MKEETLVNMMIIWISSMALFLLIAVSFGLGAWLWTYSINEWLVYADKVPVIVWWQGGLIGLCPWAGKLCIPVAILTWILMLVL